MTSDTPHAHPHPHPPPLSIITLSIDSAPQTGCVIWILPTEATFIGCQCFGRHAVGSTCAKTSLCIITGQWDLKTLPIVWMCRVWTITIKAQEQEKWSSAECYHVVALHKEKHFRKLDLISVLNLSFIHSSSTYAEVTLVNHFIFIRWCAPIPILIKHMPKMDISTCFYSCF